MLSLFRHVGKVFVVQSGRWVWVGAKWFPTAQSQYWPGEESKWKYFSGMILTMVEFIASNSDCKWQSRVCDENGFYFVSFAGCGFCWINYLPKRAVVIQGWKTMTEKSAYGRVEVLLRKQLWWPLKRIETKIGTVDQKVYGDFSFKLLKYRNHIIFTRAPSFTQHCK